VAAFFTAIDAASSRISPMLDEMTPLISAAAERHAAAAASARHSSLTPGETPESDTKSGQQSDRGSVESKANNATRRKASAGGGDATDAAGTRSRHVGRGNNNNDDDDEYGDDKTADDLDGSSSSGSVGDTNTSEQRSGVETPASGGATSQQKRPEVEWFARFRNNRAVRRILASGAIDKVAMAAGVGCRVNVLSDERTVHVIAADEVSMARAREALASTAAGKLEECACVEVMVPLSALSPTTKVRCEECSSVYS
jgi:hypothetical protein